MTHPAAREPSGASSYAWVALAVAYVVALTALVWWTLATPARILREQLKVLQCWSLDACVVAGVLFGALVLWRLARRLRLADAAAMTAVTAVALGLLLGLVPRTSRIYYDEQIYQGIGQNLADLRLAQMCNDGVIEQGRLHCAAGEYNKQPYAYPHALSLAYRAFGVRESIPFVLNAAMLALTACGVYLVVLLLFEDRVAASFAALLFALTPEQLVWSGTAAVEPSATWASVSALVATACFVRERSTATLVGAAVLLAYAVQFRPESILIATVVTALLWQRARDEFGAPRIWWVGLLLLALMAVHVAHLAAIRYDGWGTTHDRVSLAYVKDNLRVNGWFYLRDARFPWVWTLIAAVGSTGRHPRRGRATVVLYFLLFFGITLVFYAGSYDYGADVRYSLATYPALAMLGGLGLGRILRLLARVRPGPIAWQFAALLLLSVTFWQHVPMVRSKSDTAWAPRADVAFARSMVPRIRGGYVLTQNPGMFHVWGVSAGQMSLAATNPLWLRDVAARHPGRVYVHWNFWCNVDDAVQRGFCTKALGSAPSEKVGDHREAEQYLAVFRLRMPGGTGDPGRH